MNCLISKSSSVLIFILISKEICCCTLPFGFQIDICSNKRMENLSIEDNTDQKFFPTIIGMIKCLLCVTISYTKSIFNNFMKKTNIITPQRTYRYKPPPSLFETLALWTGAVREDDADDDEIWVSRKLFMLASTIIFSMLFLYYGQNWLAKLWKITELIKVRIYLDNEKVLSRRVSPSVSMATCKSELDGS